MGEGCDAAEDLKIENQDGTVCLRSQGKKVMKCVKCQRWMKEREQKKDWEDLPLSQIRRSVATWEVAFFYYWNEGQWKPD